MKNYLKYIILFFIVCLLAYFIYILSFNKKTIPVMKNLEPKLYEKLIDSNSLNTINLIKRNEYFDIEIENSYCDKNMFVVSIAIDYNKTTEKVVPHFSLKDGFFLDTASRKLSDLKDEYVFVIIPKKNIKDNIVVDIYFFNPLQLGSDKDSLNSSYMNFNLDIPKNISDDKLREFDLIDVKENDVIGNLHLSPYGMLMKIDNEVSSIISIRSGNENQIFPTGVTNVDDAYLYVFDESITIDKENKITVDFYSNDVDEKIIKSMELKVN